MRKMNLETWAIRELLELDGMEDALAEVDLDPAEMPEGELREALLGLVSGDNSAADDVDEAEDDYEGEDDDDQI